MVDFESLVADQREYFLSGETSKIAHRRAQLKKLRKVLEEEQATITDAVYRDLRRDARTSYLAEISLCIGEIDYVLEKLEEWAKPVYVEKTLTTLLDTPLIVKEPKGVVLLISPWNYPVSMIFLPLIPIVAAAL
ncbi:CBN-ALH-4 protein [Aphelenchoides avenae]|nr:CBN-ALH-4 protein [Aphelenchus avenae]